MIDVVMVINIRPRDLMESGVEVEGCQNKKTDITRRVLTGIGLPRAGAAH